jgi:hypothetical protein
MEINEIKKALYKQNPNAVFGQMQSGVAWYSAYIIDPDNESYLVNFNIPFNDMGEATFYDSMPAKFLIRWIVKD